MHTDKYSTLCPLGSRDYYLVGLSPSAYVCLPWSAFRCFNLYLSFSLLANMVRLPLKCTLLLKGVFHLIDMAGGLLLAALGLASHLLVIQDLNQPRGRSGTSINAVLSASSHQLSSDPA